MEPLEPPMLLPGTLVGLALQPDIRLRACGCAGGTQKLPWPGQGVGLITPPTVGQMCPNPSGRAPPRPPCQSAYMVTLPRVRNAIPKVTPHLRRLPSQALPQVTHPRRDLPVSSPRGIPSGPLASPPPPTGGLQWAGQGRAGRSRWEGLLGPRVRKALAPPQPHSVWRGGNREAGSGGSRGSVDLSLILPKPLQEGQGAGRKPLLPGGSCAAGWMDEGL